MINDKIMEFIILWKMIHLMFNSICNPNILLEVFKNWENLLIKDTFLSLFDIS